MRESVRRPRTQPSPPLAHASPSIPQFPFTPQSIRTPPRILPSFPSSLIPPFPSSLIPSSQPHTHSSISIPSPARPGLPTNTPKTRALFDGCIFPHAHHHTTQRHGRVEHRYDPRRIVPLPPSCAHPRTPMAFVDGASLLMRAVTILSDCPDASVRAATTVSRQHGDRLPNTSSAFILTPRRDHVHPYRAFNSSAVRP